MAKIKKWRGPDSDGGFDITTTAIAALVEDKKLETTGKNVEGKNIPVSTELGTSVMSIPAEDPYVREKPTSKIKTRD